MSLEGPCVWRIFAGKLKTITNMQKNLSRLTFISTLWHGNAQKNGHTKYSASLFFLSLHEI